MKDTIIILGSSRSAGHTRKIADYCLQHIEADIVDLNDLKITYFDYEHRNRQDDFIPLAEQMTKYKTIILATPIYWYTMSAMMKTFLDRWSDLLKIRKDIGRQFRGKQLFVIACSSDARQYPYFDQPFLMTADYMGMTYLGCLHTWVEGNETINPILKEKINQTIESLPLSNL